MKSDGTPENEKELISYRQAKHHGFKGSPEFEAEFEKIRKG